MSEAYEDLKQKAVPVFVTTDTLLHSAHLFFDRLLRVVELTTLRPQLAALTEVMLEASAQDLDTAPDPRVAEAARRNLAFFAVATRLLDPTRGVPDPVADLVKSELELIEAHRAGLPLPKSPIIGIREDYTQYIPRGHYTRSESFRSYFLAAMWYGRMGFLLYPSESHVLAETDCARLVRQALLITRNLHRRDVGDRGALDVWRGICEATALFSGRGEDPGPDEYRAVAQDVYGGLPDPVQLVDDARLGAFLGAARELPRPRVLSTYYLSKKSPDRVTPRWQDGTMGFRFLPQRFVPDTHIFSDLVWDRVGKYLGHGHPFTLYVSRYDGPYRAVPRGLDVLAVFGSKLAERILREEGDTEYQGYDRELAELRVLYACDTSGPDLYHRWLGVLRALLDESPVSALPFAHEEAWQCKELNAALGAWAELRHDTMLYVKQSYTPVPRGLVSQPAPRAYLEPYPLVYERLRALVAHMRAELSGWHLLAPGVEAKLTEFGAILEGLRDIAYKELRGEELTKGETGALVDIGQRLRAALQLPPELMAQIASGADDRMAVVADLHTHLEGNQVLEEAVGDPYSICVELEQEGGHRRYWGAVFSHYEFKQPLEQRLTDEAWQAASPRPPLAPWASRFVRE
jgi:hypothetical protein